jgi:hypothetical protein
MQARPEDVTRMLYWSVHLQRRQENSDYGTYRSDISMHDTITVKVLEPERYIQHLQRRSDSCRPQLFNDLLVKDDGRWQALRGTNSS